MHNLIGVLDKVYNLKLKREGNRYYASWFTFNDRGYRIFDEADAESLPEMLSFINCEVQDNASR